jgi:hypothetical protein
MTGHNPVGRGVEGHEDGDLGEAQVECPPQPAALESQINLRIYPKYIWDTFWDITMGKKCK